MPSLFDHIHFTLIHGPNIPDSYEILFFIALDFTFTTIHIHTWVCCFHFDSAFSFLLGLFLCSSPVAYWGPTGLGSSSFSVLPFCLFILFMGFSRQDCWSGLPFPSPMDHILSELSTMACPSLVALHSIAYAFIELDKAVIHMISLVTFLWLWFSFCHFWDCTQVLHFGLLLTMRATPFLLRDSCPQE